MGYNVDQVRSTVPDSDLEAWDFFWGNASKEQMPIKPCYTWNEFSRGKAAHMAGMIGLVDAIATSELQGEPLIPNYNDEVTVNNTVLPPLCGAFDSVADNLHNALQSSAVAVVLPHPTMVTPYMAARSVAHSLGEDILERTNIIIGPQPTVFEYHVEQLGMDLSPVTVGRMLGNLLLTGPDTDSVRGAGDELQGWLKTRRKHFWQQYNEITEPKANGDNNLVIVCPSGRRAHRGTEYRPDGELSYLFNRPVGVLPVGIADNFFEEVDKPGSAVYIRPDNTVWHDVTNNTEAQYMHERATLLADSGLRRMRLESKKDQRRRLVARSADSILARLGHKPVTDK